MLQCFYRKNPDRCRYYPRCSHNCVSTYNLEKGRSLPVNNLGPHIVYLDSGNCRIECNGFQLAAEAPDFVLVPDLEFSLHARAACRVFIFGPELVRLLTDMLAVDFYRNRFPTAKPPRPLTLLSDVFSTKFSQGIITDLFRCRHYTEHKLQEMFLLIDQRRQKEIRCNLTSKYWFFRVRVNDLLKTCTSLEEFAFAMGMSKSGFSKAFVKAFGISFYQWYQGWKLDGIADDMVRTELSFKELTGKYGFYSVQHFGHFIKQKTGLSAGQLKEKLLTDPLFGNIYKSNKTTA